MHDLPFPSTPGVQQALGKAVRALERAGQQFTFGRRQVGEPLRGISPDAHDDIRKCLFALCSQLPAWEEDEPWSMFQFKRTTDEILVLYPDSGTRGCAVWRTHAGACEIDITSHWLRDVPGFTFAIRASTNNHFAHGRYILMVQRTPPITAESELCKAIHRWSTMSVGMKLSSSLKGFGGWVADRDFETVLQGISQVLPLNILVEVAL
jgi:hypothetical protein